ncbi:hypothetical protein M2280_005012 [Prescottella agglutinans]|uniref:Uncharacterized protein n=1 Tax=Prescottella agglutinans TaxID=1644129 RepID=A0ABT6MIY6_9NOCA|nr:hypothetical protein [Prescottella agglutinans]
MPSRTSLNGYYSNTESANQSATHHNSVIESKAGCLADVKSRAYRISAGMTCGENLTTSDFCLALPPGHVHEP